MYFAPDRLEPLLAQLERHRLGEVLVVRGDPPQEPGRPVFPTRSHELVEALKRARPELRVYAAIDPYRAGLRDELELASRKRDAGADGFFSQPFFDLRLLDVWAELLTGQEVYWGVTPVVSPRARRYWETKNRAFFPADFAPELAWSRGFAARALAWARERGTNLYFFPPLDAVAWMPRAVADPAAAAPLSCARVEPRALRQALTDEAPAVVVPVGVVSDSRYLALGPARVAAVDHRTPARSLAKRQAREV